MSLFQEMIVAADYKISEGSEYLWKCYGPNARFLDFKSEEFEIEADMVFDSKNQTVYSACLFLKDKCYRWMNPDFIKAFKEESYDKNIDPRMAYEGTNFNECDVWSDFTEKVNQAFTTGQCSADILVSLEMTDELQDLIDQFPPETDIEKIIHQALVYQVDKMKKLDKANWSTLKSKLPNIYIDVDDETLLGSQNIQGVADWIVSLNTSHVVLQCSNKEVREGLLLILKYEDKQFEYFFKDDSVKK